MALAGGAAAVRRNWALLQDPLANLSALMTDNTIDLLEDPHRQ